MPDKKPAAAQPSAEIKYIPPQQPPPSPPTKPEGIFGFLKQLLPRNFDTTDLLIVLIILLMAGDCEEQRNNALLTLALYFFM